MGRATTERTDSHSDKGTLTANVVAATPDGGLVIDASFAGNDVSQPVVRVAVFPDGRLGVPPDSRLLPAVARILPLLARGIVAGRTIDVGSTMDVPPPGGAPNVQSDGPRRQRCEFAIALHETIPGRGFDESGDATAVYDTTSCARSTSPWFSRHSSRRINTYDEQPPDGDARERHVRNLSSYRAPFCLRPASGSARTLSCRDPTDVSVRLAQPERAGPAARSTHGSSCWANSDAVAQPCGTGPRDGCAHLAATFARCAFCASGAAYARSPQPLLRSPRTAFAHRRRTARPFESELRPAAARGR